MDDFVKDKDVLISRRAVYDLIEKLAFNSCVDKRTKIMFVNADLLVNEMYSLPPVQPEDYAELKREFLRMVSYIDVLLECSDEQKETLIGFISRLAEYMPWTERD